MTWLEDFCAYFLGLGYFAEFSPGDPAFLAEKLERLYESDWGVAPRAVDANVEQFLLRYDEKRTWYDTWEADVAPGNDVYVIALDALARISQGELRVSGSREVWEADVGRVTIYSRLNGKRCVFSARIDEDRMDLSFFSNVRQSLNDVSAKSPSVVALDDFFLALMLTSEQRRNIAARKGWEFVA